MKPLIVVQDRGAGFYSVRDTMNKYDDLRNYLKVNLDYHIDPIAPSWTIIGDDEFEVFKEGIDLFKYGLKLIKVGQLGDRR